MRPLPNRKRQCSRKNDVTILEDHFLFPEFELLANCLGGSSVLPADASDLSLAVHGEASSDPDGNGHLKRRTSKELSPRGGKQDSCPTRYKIGIDRTHRGRHDREHPSGTQFVVAENALLSIIFQLYERRELQGAYLVFDPNISRKHAI